MMIKKDITFIYMDSAEKSMYEPIADIAVERGYKVKFTKNKMEKCEIGIYCQHVNMPQFSKFSVIMLHDIIQQYSMWPDIWMREPWNKYDIGILPSEKWVNNWKACSQWFYTNPRKGIYKIGWPKADKMININKDEYKKDFFAKYNLDPNKYTILYAPAWENDGKQDDFVKAMLQLDVNILIKQYNATLEHMPDQYKNIKEMYELHKSIEGVTILDTKMNIFDAIIVSDVLVSEESSTMAEALMMGKPAVSVSDWLIPDVIPSRYPECHYDFVIMTKKNELKECINNIISNYPYYENQAKEYRDKTFDNLGKSSSMIMDIIDDCVNEEEIRYKAVEPANRVRLPIKKLMKYIYMTISREMTNNYCVRYKSVSICWNALRKIKRTLKPNTIEYR